MNHISWSRSVWKGPCRHHCIKSTLLTGMKHELYQITVDQIIDSKFITTTQFIKRWLKTYETLSVNSFTRLKTEYRGNVITYSRALLNKKMYISTVRFPSTFNFFFELVRVHFLPFESKHQQGCHFELICTQKPLKGFRKFKWQSVHESLKWRYRAIGIHTAGFRQQCVAQKFNVYLSIISRRLSRFQVTRHICTRQRHRRQLKTTVRQARIIVATLSLTASKLPMSYIRRLEWGSVTRVLGTVCYRMSIYVLEDFCCGKF
jgi:hypothetical protein